MKARIEFKLEDFWVGAFWKRATTVQYDTVPYGRTGSRVDVWVCIVPCFPLHLTWER
jgi:hypothetical protein